ncbi:DUF2141 domain-containing protein [Hymenobacter qilianensis]|uniref:DUF2141 domain-containing protein n=1 Tax=Hymenobacter qilianensis TaxID=1385715 RepID=UPI001667EECD|nr:DUF2141 domain-containing protein [Hymenobacter qilianensis]
MLRSFFSITLLQVIAFVSAASALCCTGTTDSDMPASQAISGSVTNLRNARGTCYVSLYNRKEGFPGKKSVATQKVQLTAKECVFVFDKLPKGDYAIAAYHDENNNGRLDTNFIGLPTEGYAFSNNPRALMGPPSFAEAKVVVHSSRVKVQLTMKY